MNTLSIVISSVAGTFLVVILVMLASKAWGSVSTAIGVLPKIASGIDKYASNIDKSEDHFMAIQVLLEGQAKMCAAQVAAINELRKTVKDFKEAVFKRDDIRSLDTPGDNEKNLAWDAKRIQAENPGMDYGTAMMKAIENELKDLNGAAGVGEFSL